MKTSISCSPDLMSFFVLFTANALKGSGPLGAGYVSLEVILLDVFASVMICFNNSYTFYDDWPSKSLLKCCLPQAGPGISLSAHNIPESGPIAPSAREGRKSPSWHLPRGDFPAPLPQNWSHR